MTSVTTAGYMTLEQAVDAIGRRLMPRKWLGAEINLLEGDKHISEELEAVDAEPATIDTPVRRLNRAVHYLLSALARGDVKAVVVDELGHSRDFPAALWGRPGIRAVFCQGELPDEFRIALEGHKVGVGSHWVRVLQSDIDQTLTELTPGPTDVEGELRAWLAAKIAKRAPGQRVSKNEIWSQAQRAFGSRMPFHAFKRIWSATVPQEWRRPERASRPSPRDRD